MGLWPLAVNQSEQSIADAFLAAGVTGLPDEAFARFEVYLTLLGRWNAHLNLTADREPQDIVRRHFVECAFAAQHLPAGLKSLLDYGSGAGFPGLPIAICSPTLRVTLAEAHGKKAGFLREAVRALGLHVDVFDGRVESLPPDACFDAVSLRAVEKMTLAIPTAIEHAREYVILFTTKRNLQRDHGSAGSRSVEWLDPIALPDADERILSLGRLYPPGQGQRPIVVPRGTR